jgi:hypothetical protein
MVSNLSSAFLHKYIADASLVGCSRVTSGRVLIATEGTKNVKAGHLKYPKADNLS